MGLVVGFKTGNYPLFMAFIINLIIGSFLIFTGSGIGSHIGSYLVLMAFPISFVILFMGKVISFHLGLSSEVISIFDHCLYCPLKGSPLFGGASGKRGSRFTKQGTQNLAPSAVTSFAYP